MEATRQSGRSGQLVSASRRSSPALPEGVAPLASLTAPRTPRTVGAGRRHRPSLEGAAILSTSHLNEEIIRVLFIEADPAVAEMYRLKLELDGYHVAVVARDDRRFATLHELRATTATRDLPMIILSNVGASELTAQGYNADLLDYVVRAAPDLNGLSWNAEE